jgi:hypothetical protein
MNTAWIHMYLNKINAYTINKVENCTSEYYDERSSGVTGCPMKQQQQD